MQVLQYFLTGHLLAIVFSNNVRALPAEPVCSKFDYEMKTLEAMLRIENRAEKMMEELKSVQDSMTKELHEIRKNLKAEVESQQTAMESKITVLKSEAERQQTAMESKFTALKSETERQQTAMESKFTALKSEVEEVPEKMTEEMQSLRVSMTKGLDEAEKQRTATESKITALKSEVAKKLAPDDVIAFSVKSPTKKLVNRVPTFNTVITNIGNGYDVDTGIFTCPVGGLYMFVFTVLSNGQNDVYCFITHNGTDKAIGQSYSDNSYTAASVSVNLLLQKGDSVMLGRCGGWNHVNSWTTFSGALLRKTNREN